MKRAAMLGLVLGGLAGLACVHVEVRTEADPAIDWSRFHSFAESAAAPDETAVDARIRQEIAARLEARGLRSAPLESADLVVSFRSSAASRARMANAGDPDANWSVVQNYTQGTLEIDVFERATRQRVWRGVGNVDIYSQKEVERAAADAVEAVLARFPWEPAPASRGAP